MTESIAAEILRPVIEDGVKRVGATIKRQFNYLCCFTSNITTLKDEARALDDEAKGLQGRVDGARNDAQIIVPAVETWITKSEAINAEMNEILNEVPNVGSGCLKLKSRFSLSKRAKKTTDRMKELRDQCKFDAISLPRPPAATEAVLLGTTYEFQSRKQIEEDIMTSLRDGDVNIIGICGMGGLGKTTMAKMIMNRALKEHVFEEVVMAVVSQPVDKLKIQVEIGGPLGLRNLKEEASMANRVQALHKRLTQGTKRILLVLDDVWEKLVLEDLGIPCGCKSCTILLTSRNSDVLRAMNVEKIFGMKVLSEEEAWFLFRERAGTCADDTKLNSFAKQVTEECKGLPIALMTVGAALKDEKNASIWKDALRQLTRSDPDIPQVIAEVYNPLKLSYDALGSEHVKSVFLLCCLFKEDVDIPVEKLTYFSMGLGIFEGVMEEARNRICALTKMLKSRSLLLDSKYGDNYVRMHDVVRDVCIFIAKQKRYIGHNDCTWISSSLPQVRERTKVTTNLRLLLLSTGDSDIEEEFKLDSIFVEGIRDLQVLCIEKYSLTSLPHATSSLKNLNTLVLDSCGELETISVVGELINLEILICRDCGSINELPPEMKGLNSLKLLEISWCQNLKRIGRGIISSLVALEELKITNFSFDKWEAWDRKEKENAALRELEALTKLRCLDIEIEDPTLAAENIRLSSNLERFYITIRLNILSATEFFPYSCNKKLYLDLKEGSCVGHWLEMQLLRDTECLYLSGDGANNVNMAKNQNIRWLYVGCSRTRKNIGRTSLMDNAAVFPHMEFLHLFFLPELEEIFDGPYTTNSLQNLKQLSLQELWALKQFWKSNYVVSVFHNLTSIEIGRCHCLRNLGQLSIAGNGCLSHLETLRIHDCKMMEHVLLWNEEDQNKSNSESRIAKMFTKLSKVDLSYLPNLVTFCQGIESIEFPLLTEMHITACPKMTGMVSSNEKNSGGTNNADNIDDHHSLHLFCQLEKVSFGNLKELETNWNPFCGHKTHVSLFNGLENLTMCCMYGDSKGLFTSCIAGNLVSLIKLRIDSCDEIVKVIKDDEEEKAVSGGQRTALLFPKLQVLELCRLPKLVSFYEWKFDVEFPSLSKADIYECPDMKYFTLGLLTTPKLEVVRINDEEFGGLKDLNGVVQQQFEKKQQEAKKGSAEVQKIEEEEELNS